MITGYFLPHILPQPLVQVVVHIDGHQPEWAPVPFVVDTGAAVTCIHALDAIRLFGMSPGSLDPATWPETTPVGGIGGGLSYLTLPARYAFRHDDGTFQVIEGPIRVGEARSQGTPALLGWDLLRHFRLTVSGNGPSVTLEPL